MTVSKQHSNSPKDIPVILLSILRYDETTGELTWASSKVLKLYQVKHGYGGMAAGNIDKCGYVVITFRGQKYYAHRIAWMFLYNEQPPPIIDHINGVRSDNSKENLRAVSQTYNILASMDRRGYKPIQMPSGSYKAKMSYRGMELTKTFKDALDACIWRENLRQQAMLLESALQYSLHVPQDCYI